MIIQSATNRDEEKKSSRLLQVCKAPSAGKDFNFFLLALIVFYSDIFFLAFHDFNTVPLFQNLIFALIRNFSVKIVTKVIIYRNIMINIG